MSGKQDAEELRRYQAPYSGHRPIPTISKYREERAARQDAATKGDNDIAHDHEAGEKSYDGAADKEKGPSDQQPLKDTSEIDPSSTDVRQRRKESKSKQKERAERQVTDPVTHLPVTIHDFTDDALENVEYNEVKNGASSRTSTGLDNQRKPQKTLRQEEFESNEGHEALVNEFPQPDFGDLRRDLEAVSNRGVTVALVGYAVILTASFTLEKFVGGTKMSWVVLVLCVGAITLVTWLMRSWSAKEVNKVLEDEIWDAHRRKIKDDAKKSETETTVWLNSLLHAVWPLVNPDLFTSLTDTLEDVMQASLPKIVRMVSVDDLGQGSEAIRILGVRWLPTGAAAKAVKADGSPASAKNTTDKETGDETGDQPEDEKSGDSNDKGGGQVLQAEEGDFVNIEIAFAYRTRASSKTMKERKNDMHLYLAFYLPGNIKVPVWVNLQGIIGTVRMRLQLTPDPPFFGLCTMTFLGQPRVNVSCMPLSQKGLNIMDVPLISSFVQSSIDAAAAMYVAPKSLSLDLKDLLAGDDFKKNTNAKGVIMVNIKRGYDFKMGDTAIPLVSDGASDPYVSVGWAKFGKVLWSTRVMKSEMEPCWDETCFVLVTPEELDIDERLRIQLWDSDRFTADDDLGRIEVDLRELMSNEESSGKMTQRSDGFRALKSGEDMPGKLDWSVGYFSKTRIMESQFQQQTRDPEVRTMEQLKEKVDINCERKLREAIIKEKKNRRSESELEQQKKQELIAEQDAMIISAPPPEGYPSGVFSIQIHNITGMELNHLNKQQQLKVGEVSDDEEEGGENLPSAYCTIIVNHRKTFRTRTKPQNAKPFFNAGCERFIRDWRDCEVYVSVRDARLHEDDPLVGIVHLPLHDVFEKRSQVMGFYSLSGGIGHGRIRISMVWRSVELQAPSNLLGWQYGTVEVRPSASSSDVPEDLRKAKLKFKTNISKGKMYPNQEDGGTTWKSRGEKKIALAVQQRYSTCLSIAFRDKSRMLSDSTSAFCVLWLKDIPDEEEQELQLPIWKGDFNRAITNCMNDYGEKVGTLRITATFWAGLGSAHSHWASGTQSLRDVVEVIDTARDDLEQGKMEKKAGIVDADVSSDSDSSDSSDDDTAAAGSGDGPDGSTDDKQGPLDQVHDYRRKAKTLHRQHKGLMQWKIPRTAKWMKHKWDRVEDKVTDMFEHQSKQQGVETEV